MRRFLAFSYYDRTDAADNGEFQGSYDSVAEATLDSAADGAFLDVLDTETNTLSQFVRAGAGWINERPPSSTQSR